MADRPALHTTSALTGRASELHVMAQLTYIGVPVFTTEHPHTRADLLVEVDGKIERIQVKSMVWKDSAEFYRVRPEHHDHPDYGDTIDHFVFYCREENEYFVISYEEATELYEITWIPPWRRTRETSSRKQIDLDDYKDRWELILGDELTEWQEERLQELTLNRERG